MTTAQSQVLYRKWRPGTFYDLSGQEHISNTLRNAVMQDRIAQAYLFCGTRGSGKTTTARILAKAVNCLNPDDGNPCDQCQICGAINDGRNIDIIELDAASNRGVDEIREIRDKSYFQPAINRRKVYIIDEAHMLTREASNAFLKTLEEPPEHVVFILCTTEAERLLPTILSRCQRYDFRKLPSQSITERIQYICHHEQIDVDEDGARAIARFANGSMRDALTILEQVAIEHPGLIDATAVETSLGIVRSDAFLTLAQQLIQQDTPGSLDTINTFAWEGGDRVVLHRNVLDLLRSTLLISFGAAQKLDLHQDTMAALQASAADIDPKRLNATVHIWADAAAHFRYDAPSTLPLELAAAEIGQWTPPPPPDPAANASPPPPERQPSQRRPPSRGNAQPRGNPQPSNNPQPSGQSQPNSNPQPRGENGPSGESQPNNAPQTRSESQNRGGSQRQGQPPDDRRANRPTPNRSSRGRSNPPQQRAANGGNNPLPRRSRTPTPPDPSKATPPEGADETQQLLHRVVVRMAAHRGERFNLGALLRDVRILNASISNDTLVLPFTSPNNLERIKQEMQHPPHDALFRHTIAEVFQRDLDYSFTLDPIAQQRQIARAQDHNLVKAAIGLGGKIVAIQEPPTG